MTQHDETPEEVLVDVRFGLYELGYTQALNVSPVDPAGALLIAELANHVAKSTNDYKPKVKAFAAAAMLPGVESGWSLDEDNAAVFVLSAPGVGEVRAHDPYGELRCALNVWGYRPRAWSGAWSGEHAQPYILDVLEIPDLRRLREYTTTAMGRGGLLGRAVRRLRRGRTTVE